MYSRELYYCPVNIGVVLYSLRPALSVQPCQFDRIRVIIHSMVLSL